LDDDGEINVRGPESGTPHTFVRQFDQSAAVGAAPLLVVSREHLTDVAEGRRTEESIYQGMQYDVGIGMPQERPRVSREDSAERERGECVARFWWAERVHIETVPDSHRGSVAAAK
jgi:hypothetical protein